MTRALSLVDSSDKPFTHESASARNQLLETKLYVPRPRSDLVARPRLNNSIGQKLTVVVAPAGFGKTTLVSGWLADRVDSATASWVSLDPAENEPSLFWAYVVRALQKRHSAVGASALSQLSSGHPPPVESVLGALINEIEASDRDFTLVLDDYHVIDAAPIHGALTYLLDRLPRRMNVVIASRVEPPLALHRLRARGELTEFRAADLRFTADETSAFLSQVMALELSPDDTAKLGQRTEGWIAGLKMAALSMKARGVRGFVDGFSGDNRHIADYLVEEVLRSEPEHIRRFLLATSILDRMNGPLCEAVTGERESQALLQDLERRNLFVVPLDDRRAWYRYHHLFADVLQKQLARDRGDSRAAHGRASIWHEANGSRADAIRHALQAGDFERAADLLEHTWPEMDRSYASRAWLDRVKMLPEAVVRVRPVLTMAYAWGLLNSGELEAVEPRLASVERWLESVDESSDQMVVTNHDRFRTLPAELAAARVYLTQSLGDAPGTLENARRALTLATDDVGLLTATALLALALWGRGDLEEAHTTFSDALAIMRRCGLGLDVVRGVFVLGDIRVAQGRLRDAARTYEQGLELAAAEVQSTAVETDELNLGLSEVHREWNDFASAVRFLNTITQSVAQRAHAGNRRRWCTAMASVRAAEGDLDGALELLDEGDRHDRRDPVPRTRPIAAMKARIHIAQGRLDAAADWLARAKLSIDDDLSYLREFDHITLARLLIARHGSVGGDRSLSVAERLLERLTTAAQTGGRMGSVIEILVLRSRVQQASGNLRGALDHLAEALALAEPEGYLRVFIDEGAPMLDLLRHATTRGLAGPYTRQVLAAFSAPVARPPAAPPGDGTAIASGSAQALTTRELEILRLIAGGLRNQEIADHLSISAATVKRHIANAYTKLGASHRTEALARAKELKLL